MYSLVLTSFVQEHNSAMLIAWDIETCPLDYDALPSTHQDRNKHEREYESIMRNDSEISSEGRRRRLDGARRWKKGGLTTCVPTARATSSRRCGAL